jgi:hypothetical protein
MRASNASIESADLVAMIAAGYVEVGVSYVGPALVLALNDRPDRAGGSQFFKISCGCKDTPPAEHDSYKLEVLNGY